MEVGRKGHNHVVEKGNVGDRARGGDGERCRLDCHHPGLDWLTKPTNTITT